MTDLPTIGVLGLGTMGAGIVQVFAAAGHHVVAVEADQAALRRGLSSIEDFLSAGVSRGKGTESEARAVLARITGSTDVTDLGAVDLVLECVGEDLALKRDVLDQVAASVGADVPLLTNTSALSVTELAAALPHPERVAGLHFFNPAPVQRTVEVVRAQQTDPRLVERLTALVDGLRDKTPVVVDDRPGFLVNSLLLPYLNDVVQAYDEDLATAEDIDTALRLGLGYKTGPLEMLDTIGLDVALQATDNAYAATRDPRYAAPPLLRRMVAAGALGAKNGRGFRTTTDAHDAGGERR